MYICVAIGHKKASVNELVTPEALNQTYLEQIYETLRVLMAGRQKLPPLQNYPSYACISQLEPEGIGDDTMLMYRALIGILIANSTNGDYTDRFLVPVAMLPRYQSKWYYQSLRDLKAMHVAARVINHPYIVVNPEYVPGIYQADVKLLAADMLRICTIEVQQRLRLSRVVRDGDVNPSRGKLYR